jgi:L-asparaginase/Glu-tRNA(Gln) amidotransferase subunit D
MNHFHWKTLAEEVAAEIKAGSHGVVVMHGTDTMTYTSAALSFMLRDLPVPVVFVGSQRSSDRPSSENAINMMNAVFSAKQDLGEVGVCMHASSNDDFCLAQRLQRKLSVDIVNLSGRLGIRQLGALIKRCQLYISNDTGPMHIAAILNTPLIAIFGPGQLICFDPRRISPKSVVLYKK